MDAENKALRNELRRAQDHIEQLRKLVKPSDDESDDGYSDMARHVDEEDRVTYFEFAYPLIKLLQVQDRGMTGLMPEEHRNVAHQVIVEMIDRLKYHGRILKNKINEGN